MKSKNKKMVSDHSLTDIISILNIEPQIVSGLYVQFSDPLVKEIALTYPFRIDSFLIFIITSGKITTQINLLDNNLTKGDVLILPPHTIVQYKKASEDFQQITINFTLDFALNCSIKNQLSTANFLINNETKFFKVDNFRLSTLYNLSLLILNKNSNFCESNTTEFLKEFLQNIFSNILLEFFSIEKFDLEKSKIKSRKELIFIELLKLIRRNFREHRNVEFYANSLSVSKSYLNKITKSLNNKTVNDLIDYAIITEAKFLLSNLNFTINYIAENLNFSDQSSFGKYFKKHTSLTPFKYRKQNTKE